MHRWAGASGDSSVAFDDGDGVRGGARALPIANEASPRRSGPRTPRRKTQARMTDGPTTTPIPTRTPESNPGTGTQPTPAVAPASIGDPPRRDLIDRADDAPPTGTAFRPMGTHTSDDEPGLAVAVEASTVGAAAAPVVEVRSVASILPPKTEVPHPLGARHQQNQQNHRNQQAQQTQHTVQQQQRQQGQNAPRNEPVRQGQIAVPTAPKPMPAQGDTSTPSAAAGCATGGGPEAKSASTPAADNRPV